MVAYEMANVYVTEKPVFSVSAQCTTTPSIPFFPLPSSPPPSFNEEHFPLRKIPRWGLRMAGFRALYQTDFCSPYFAAAQELKQLI